MDMRRGDFHSERAQQKFNTNLSNKYTTLKYTVIHILLIIMGIGNISGYLEVRVNLEITWMTHICRK